MTEPVRLYFDLADAITIANHAAACTYHLLPTEQERANDLPAQPAVVLAIDTDVYLISNGTPSQGFWSEGPCPFTARLRFHPWTADQVRRAVSIGGGTWLHYRLPADGDWVHVGRHARQRGYDLLAVDPSDLSVAVGRRRLRTRAATRRSPIVGPDANRADSAP